MAANYYYFAGSLPYLRLGVDPPLSSAEFLERAREHVTGGEWAALAAVGLEPRDSSCCVVEARWHAFETCVRNALVRVRAHRLKRDAHSFLRPETEAFGFLEAQVQEAFAHDPLRLEEQLDGLRWQRLDDLAVGHYFDFEALLIYRLKLLLLEKRAGLDPAAGRRELERCLTEKLMSPELPELIHAG